MAKISEKVDVGNMENFIWGESSKKEDKDGK